METVVTYGTIMMRNVQTRQFEEEVMYDETGTDRLGIKYRCTFQGLIHVDSNATRTWVRDEQTNTYEEHATVQLAEVRKQLTTPRRPLKVFMDNRVLIEIDPASKTGNTIGDNGKPADLINGPHPTALNIVHVASGQYYRVTWAVEAARLETDSEGTASDYVVNNRWSVGEIMDDKYFVTRVIRGRMRMASANIPAHKFKDFTVPPLEDGFRRQSIQFIQSANGLDCDYEVIDRQVHTAAPWPAVRLSGRHESTSNDGVTFVSTCNVRLDGAPASDKAQMIQRGIQIVEMKLGLRLDDKDAKREYIPIHASIVDNFGDENSVEVAFAVKHVPQTDADPEKYSVALANIVGRIGQTLTLSDLPNIDKTYDPRKSWAPGIYGYNPCSQGSEAERLRTWSPTSLTVLTCYLQDVSYYDDTYPHRNRTDHRIASAPTEQQEQFGNALIPFDQVLAANESGTTTNTGIGNDAAVYPTIKGAVSDITDEKLEESDDPGKWVDDYTEGMYTVYRVDSDYDSPQGRVQLPITAEASGSSDTHALVRLARPVSRRRVRIEAERVGTWPKLPQPIEEYTDGESSDPITVTLLSKHESPVATSMAPDGATPVYRISAEYVYALSRQPTNSETTRVGALLNFNLTDEQNDLNRSKLYSGGTKV